MRFIGGPLHGQDKDISGSELTYVVPELDGVATFNKGGTVQHLNYKTVEYDKKWVSFSLGTRWAKVPVMSIRGLNDDTVGLVFTEMIMENAVKTFGGQFYE